MATFTTQSSTLLSVFDGISNFEEDAEKAQEAKKRLEAIIKAHEERHEAEEHDENGGNPFLENLDATVDMYSSTAVNLWVKDNAGSFDMDLAAGLLSDVMMEFGLPGPVAISWAHGCSRPLSGTFGGGSMLVFPSSPPLAILSYPDRPLLAATEAREKSWPGRPVTIDMVMGLDDGGHPISDVEKIIREALKELGDLDDLDEVDSTLQEIPVAATKALARLRTLRGMADIPLPEDGAWLLSTGEPIRNDAGMLLVGTEDRERCLGHLMDFGDHGLHSPEGKVSGISKEEATEGNRLLDVGMVDGLDSNCEVGQGAWFYPKQTATGRTEVRTWTGIRVDESAQRIDGGIEFQRKGKTFEGELEEESEAVFFIRTL